MNSYAYYNGKFGKRSDISIPLSDRTIFFGDAIYEVSKGNNNASYLGALTFASNIANAISQLGIGVLLDVIKFDSSLTVQSLTVQSGLALILFVGVQTFLILGCLIFACNIYALVISSNSETISSEGFFVQSETT